MSKLFKKCQIFLKNVNFFRDIKFKKKMSNIFKKKIFKNKPRKRFDFWLNPTRFGRQSDNNTMFATRELGLEARQILLSFCDMNPSADIFRDLCLIMSVEGAPIWCKIADAALYEIAKRFEHSFRRFWAKKAALNHRKSAK